MTDAPDWEGFGRDLLESWPVRDVDASELFDAALRNGLIREIPGGYDPDKHIDAEGICPGRGDPWYEYAFRRAALAPSPDVVRGLVEAASRYAHRYCRDEADDPALCVTPEQHEDAKALFAAIAALEKEKPNG